MITVVYRVALYVIAGAVLLSVTATARAAPSAKKLYTALLTKPWPVGQLPNNDFVMKKSAVNPSKTAREHHSVGDIEVDIAGDDPTDTISYDVFPTSRDATADLRDARPPSGSGLRLHIVPGGVPGYKDLPNRMYDGSFTGKSVSGQTVTNGVTTVAVAKGNVVVSAFADSIHANSSVRVPHVLALLKSGIRHLRGIEAKLT